MSSREVTAVHRKSRPDAPDGFFEAEAAGLRWLAEAEPAGGARIVRVVGVGRHHLDLARLELAAATSAAAAALGRELAVTHGFGAPAFGCPPEGWSGDAWIGNQPQSNRPTSTWGRYFAEQRVRPFVRKAVDVGHLGRDEARLVDRVCDRISAGEYDDENPPARIHGDLWSGNVVFTAAGAVLIDPAAHGGHGLTDLAMLDLFGCPGLERLLAAYAEAASLQPGWRRLVPLHQLHPLATHTASHGPSYAGTLVAAARSVA